MRRYVVTKTTILRWAARYHGIPRCMKCGQAFQEHDVVVVIYRPKTKRYHAQCFEALYHE